MPTPLEIMRTGLGAAVSGASSGLPAANALCAACVDLLHVDGAAISMVHDGFSHGTFGASCEPSRRLDEYQFTYGQGPCLDAAASGAVVLAPDLDAASESRWPVFSEAVLGDGIRAVFALPVVLASVCVGALDLFREGPGPLGVDQLAGALVAAELAALPLLDLAAEVGAGTTPDDEDAWHAQQGLDRVEVYQATGMLVAQLDVDPTEALVRLRAHAIAVGRTAGEVAWDIIERRLVLGRDDDERGR